MKRYSWLLAVVSVLLFGCGDNSKPEQTAQEVEPEWKSWPSVNSPSMTSYRRLFGEEPIPYRREMLGDHNSILYYPNNLFAYDIPKAKEWQREVYTGEPFEQIRFLGVARNRNLTSDADSYEKRKKVWSMNLDGTDLRLVYDQREIAGDVAMSPNGRYLAVNTFDPELEYKTDYLVVDMETGESILLNNEHEYKTQFSWTDDSRYVFFGEGWDGWKRFDTQTKQIEDFSGMSRGIEMQFVGDMRVVVKASRLTLYEGQTENIIGGPILFGDETTPQKIMHTSSKHIVVDKTSDMVSMFAQGDETTVDVSTLKFNYFERVARTCLKGVYSANRDLMLTSYLIYDTANCKLRGVRQLFTEGSEIMMFGGREIYGFHGKEVVYESAH